LREFLSTQSSTFSFRAFSVVVERRIDLTQTVNSPFKHFSKLGADRIGIIDFVNFRSLSSLT